MKKFFSIAISFVICLSLAACGGSGIESENDSDNKQIADANNKYQSKTLKPTAKPATPKPATPKSATSKPATSKPATPKPATSKPATSSDVKIAVVSGSKGANSSEECANLYDDNVYTKWCVANFSSAYAIFELSSAASINGFNITTANDNKIFKRRNPKIFALYGSNKSTLPAREDSSWKAIYTQSDDNVLQDVNYTEYNYSMKSESDTYQYYKLEISATKGDKAMQMSEFALKSGKYKFSPLHPSTEAAPSDNSSSTGGSSSISGSDDSQSYSKSKSGGMSITCAKCHGSGKVTCNSCSGRGYFNEYNSTPNYSGKAGGAKSYNTKRDCPVCDNGQRPCTSCGGDGVK